MSERIVRDAERKDAGALLDIYRPFVTDTAVSFEREPPSLREFEARIASARSQWAWLLSEEGGEVQGYACATAFRARPAYRFSVEVSAYTHPDHRGQGVAAALYRRLFEVLVAKGYCTAFAGIVLPNEGSVAFHRAQGFSAVGVFHRAGWKFEKWHDVSMWERNLQERAPLPDVTPAKAGA